MDFGPKHDEEGAATTASSSPVPIMLGSAGLIGRPSVRPVEQPDSYDYDEEGNRFFVPVRTTGMPSPCTRLLTVPDRGDGTHQCDVYCPGRQRDGGCLCDIVKECKERGVGWLFEVDSEGFWNYVEQ